MLEFAAAAVEHAALALRINVDPATPYAPHEKGKVERLHRTIAESFVATLPAYENGPRDHRRQLEAAGVPLELAELVTRFDAWVCAYFSRQCGRGSQQARRSAIRPARAPTTHLRPTLCGSKRRTGELTSRRARQIEAA